MSPDYAQGLELLTRVQQKIKNIKSDAMNHGVAVQKWYALSQDWNSLTAALIATSEAANKAAAANKQQRVRFRIHAKITFNTGEFRDAQADACLRHFRYVTALSQHARNVAENHAAARRSWENLHSHYEGALGLHAHVVRPHRHFLDDLGINIETRLRTQRLQTVCVRYFRLRAAANLKKQAEEFHETCKQLKCQREKKERARKRAIELQAEATRCANEYGDLEMGVLNAEMAIQALLDKSDREGGERVASASGQDENYDQSEAAQLV